MPRLLSAEKIAEVYRMHQTGLYKYDEIADIHGITNAGDVVKLFEGIRDGKKEVSKFCHNYVKAINMIENDKQIDLIDHAFLTEKKEQAVESSIEEALDKLLITVERFVDEKISSSTNDVKKENEDLKEENRKLKERIVELTPTARHANWVRNLQMKFK